jgi:integrase
MEKPMKAKTRITKRAVDALRPGESLLDDDITGFIVRCLPSGKATYGYRFYNRTGKRRWLSLGLHGEISPDGARVLAKRAAGKVAEGRDPVAEEQTARAVTVNSLDTVLDQYLSRHVRKLRNSYEVERIFRVYVRPKLGKLSIYDISRVDVIKLLDDIEDQNGGVMADMALAYLRGAFNWWALRDEQFRPPIVRGMGRTSPEERARSRTLTDLEVQVVWRLADAVGVYGQMLRFVLLTSARLSEARLMPWNELVGRDWTLPAIRNKTKLDHIRPLSDAALETLPKRIGDCPFVFSDDGKHPVGEARWKRRFDAMVLAELRKIGAERNDKDLLAFVTKVEILMAQIRKARGNERKRLQKELRAIWWGIHDLRRTARTLMSRARVEPDIAERVLGHTIGGIRGVYDKHAYFVEKRDALEKLAGMIGRIVSPSDATVVAFPQRSA